MRLPEKAQPYDGKSHDRAAVIGDRERFRHAGSPGCVGRADIGLRGNSHAEETGEGREDRSDEETDRGDPVPDPDSDHNEEDRGKDHKHLVLREEERVGSFPDCSRDLLHAVGPFFLLPDASRKIQRKYKCQNGTDRYDHQHIHFLLSAVIH